MAAALEHVPAFLAALPSEAPAPSSPWLRPTASGLLVPSYEGLQVPTQVNYVAKSAPIYDPGEAISGATSVIKPSASASTSSSPSPSSSPSALASPSASASPSPSP